MPQESRLPAHMLEIFEIDANVRNGSKADVRQRQGFSLNRRMDDHRTSCGHMDGHPQNDWGTVRYDVRFDVYWVAAGAAKQQLFYCPWCGEQLPPSERDRWFEELEALGIDPATGPIPEDYRSGAWRGAPGLAAPPRQGGSIDGRYVDFFDMPEGVEDND